MFEVLDNDFYDYDDNNTKKEIDLLINQFKDFDY